MNRDDLSGSTFVLLAGLPGTGKSTLAAGLVKCLDAVVLSKDEIRASLFPGRALDASAAQNRIAMQALLAAAVYIADGLAPAFIILDGRTFSRAEDIREVTQAAEDAGCKWRILHLRCGDDAALKRIEGSSKGHRASNRDRELYFAIKRHFEVIREPHLCVDTGRSIEQCLSDCQEYLTGQAS